MAIKQIKISGHIVTYDDERNDLLDFDMDDENKITKAKATIEILSKKEEFKQRGTKVVKPEFIDSWKTLVDSALTIMENVWYNGVILEVSLQCMEKLSEGLSVQEVYALLDVPSVQFNMELSGWQNYSAINIVTTYHERGQEFCNYRNKYVSENIRKKRI